MASPPSDTVFRKDDFSDTGLGAKSVLDKLFLPLNAALKAIRGALNKGLTFSENMNAEVRTFSLVVPPTGSAFPLNIKTTVSRPRGAFLVSCLDQKAPGTVLSLGTLQWATGADGTLQVMNIPGLSAGHTYTMTVVIIAG